MKLKKVYLFLLLFVIHKISFSQSENSNAEIFSKADSLRGFLSAERSCYDVLFYDLQVKIDIENKFISGKNEIRFKALNDFEVLQVDLFENFVIEKIEFEGTKLVFKREFNAVFISFPAIISKGSKGRFVVHYSGKPQVAKHAPWDGGFSWAKDKEGNDWVGVSCQGLGASSWWPCKDHQSDEPDSMNIRISVPSDYEGISNGRLMQVKKLEDGWSRFDWHVSSPINTYGVSINIAKYKHFKDTYKNPSFKKDLTLDYYVLPENLEKSKVHFEQVKPMLDCYTKLFGEYPFVRDGYKLVETSYLGMEHQSCIAYGNKYLNGYLGKDLSGMGTDFDYIIIHESAHEWWGNSITTNDIADMWIHEGFATYAEALYVECQKGYPAYLKYINSKKKSVKNKEPIIGNYNVNDKGSNDMYPKGALLLHTIRSIIDDDPKFFSIIKGIQDSFKYKTVNTDAIEKYISRHAGKDFSAIFDFYLRGEKIPKLEIRLEKDSIGFTLNYRYVIDGLYDINTYKNLEFPVKVTLRKEEFHLIYPTTLWKSICLTDMKVEDFQFAEELFYMDSELVIEEMKKEKKTKSQ